MPSIFISYDVFFYFTSIQNLVLFLLLPQPFKSPLALNKVRFWHGAVSRSFSTFLIFPLFSFGTSDFKNELSSYQVFVEFSIIMLFLISIFSMFCVGPILLDLLGSVLIPRKRSVLIYLKIHAQMVLNLPWFKLLGFMKV